MKEWEGGKVEKFVGQVWRKTTKSSFKDKSIYFSTLTPIGNHRSYPQHVMGVLGIKPRLWA